MQDFFTNLDTIITSANLYFFNDLLPRLKLIVTKPFIQTDLLWMVIPLLFILFFIQLYFGRYKTEQLGWNTAFGNAVSLFWVNVILLRFIFEDIHLSEITQGRNFHEFILVGILILWTLVLLGSDYYHLLPRKVAFFLSSAIPINTIAYLFIVIIIGDIPINSVTFVAGLVLLLLVALFFKTMRAVIKPAPSVEKTLERHELKKKQIKGLKKTRRQRKIWEIELKTKHIFERIKKGIHEFFRPNSR